jgi:hypothetical protein
MATRKSATPTAAGDVYQWADYPDDPTLGGAITAEMHAELQASGAPPDPEPEPEPEPEP